MRPLRLHASALNDDEYGVYTSSLKELAEIEEGGGGVEQGDEYFERITLGVREVRAWLRGRYSSIPAGTIDTILKYFSPNLAHGDTLSGGQFFAALRLITHVQSGQELDRGLAFVQARIPSSRPPSPRKQAPQPPPPRRILTDAHPQPPQHPSHKSESGSNPFVARPPKPIVPPAKSEDGSLSKGPPLPPRKSAPATQTSFLPPPRHASSQPTTTLPPVPPMPPVPSASSSSAAQQHRPPPPQPPPKPSIPVSSTAGGHVTSNLIKQSLQASKVAHSMKRAEEQLEKERIMQVLKSSNPLASVGAGATSSPFRQLPQPPPSNTKPRSQSPGKPVPLPTSSSFPVPPIPQQAPRHHHHSSAMSISGSSSRSSADSTSPFHQHPPPLPPVRPFQHRRASPSMSSIVSSSAMSAGSLEQVALASPPHPPQLPVRTRPRQSSSPFRGADPYQQQQLTTDDLNPSPYGSPSRKPVNLTTTVELVRPPTHPDRDRSQRRQPPTLQTSTSSAFDAVYGEQSQSARSSPASITGFKTPFSEFPPSSSSSLRVRAGSSGENSPIHSNSQSTPTSALGGGSGSGGRVWRSRSLHHHSSSPSPATPNSAVPPLPANMNAKILGMGHGGGNGAPEIPPRRGKKRPESMQVLPSSSSSSHPFFGSTTQSQNVFDEPTVDRDSNDDDSSHNARGKWQAPPRHGSLSRHSSVGSSGKVGHRKSSLSVSAISGTGGSPFGDDGEGEGNWGRDRDGASDRESRSPVAIGMTKKSRANSGSAGVPSTTTDSSTKVPNPLKTAFAQTKITLNDKLTETFEQLQPKLEKARYKAEAGLLPRRGFVPPSAMSSSHSHSSSNPHPPLIHGSNSDGIRKGGGGGIHRRHGEDERGLILSRRGDESSDDGGPGGMDSGPEDDEYWRTGRTGRERDDLKWPVGEGEGWTRL